MSYLSPEAIIATSYLNKIGVYPELIDLRTIKPLDFVTILMNLKIVENSNLSELSKKISKAVKHVGNLDCDLILSNKKFFIIDFNPRFGGGYPFTHLAGKNYIMKIICNLLKKNYRIRKKAKLLTAMKSINLTVKNEKKNNFNL